MVDRCALMFLILEYDLTVVTRDIRHFELASVPVLNPSG